MTNHDDTKTEMIPSAENLKECTCRTLRCSTTPSKADRALLVFRAPDRSIVDNFAKRDPYVMNGLVTQWSVRAWTQVIATAPGEEALITRR